MLWVDKHRPKSLDKLDYHPELTKRLSILAQTNNLPHLLFYGPSGSGKKTRVMALLRAVFGPGVEKLKLEQRTFKTPSKRSIEISTLGSAYHIEINPSDTGSNDRYVVQEIIKEMAQYHRVSFASTSKTSGGNASSSSSTSKKEIPAFKVLFLSDCDSLTKEAQHGLRRTMERYVQTCRLILCCENVSKVIEPLRSRTLGIRVPSPGHPEICSILSEVGNKENLNISPAIASAIASASGRNLRRALLMLEQQRLVEIPADGNQTPKIKLPDYELYIKMLAGKITVKQDPQTLAEARGYLYELLGNCIPATLIIRTLVRCLSPKLEDDLKHEMLHWAAHYEHQMQRGDKDIYHLEAFIAKFMLLYRNYLLKMFD